MTLTHLRNFTAQRSGIWVKLRFYYDLFNRVWIFFRIIQNKLWICSNFGRILNSKIKYVFMKKKTIWILAFVALGLILIVWAWSGYNSLVSTDERAKEFWARVNSAYQRRLDLIPNLVNTVKGSANFEKETLTAVIEARAKATQVQVNPEQLTEENIRKFQQAQSGLSQALGRLLVLTENYPQLRSTSAFADLQAQIEGTENRIKVARDDFNQAVREYNIQRRKFPTNILASLFSFPLRSPFEADIEAAKAPTVNF